MTKEHEQPSQELSIERVAGLAKEVCLKDGYHVPTLILNSGSEFAIGHIHDFADTHEERKRQLFAAGLEAGMNRHPEQAREIFLITEAWMATVEDGVLPDTPPSQNPDRIETLIITKMTVKDQRVQIIGYEMIRDENDDLIELKDLKMAEQDIDSGESPLLRAAALGHFLGSQASSSGQSL